MDAPTYGSAWSPASWVESARFNISPWVSGLALAVSTVAVVLFHFFEWQRGLPYPGVVQAGYHLVVTAQFLSLATLLAHHLHRRSGSPGRTFWHLLLFSILLLGASRLIANIGYNPVPDVENQVLGFDVNTGAPLTLVTVIKLNLIALLEGSFALLLLLRLRDLVLFKRTRSSQRNWYRLLGLIVLATLLTVANDPTADLNVWQAIVVAPVVVFMMINSFRLSWIAFLSFREKMSAIGLSLLLLLVFSGLFASGMEGRVYAYLGYYSYPLRLFVLLTMSFGVLYATTAFLSLLFHLPTTSDFQQKAGEIAAMHSLSHLAGQMFDAEKLARNIIRAPVEARSGDAAFIALADPTSGTLTPQLLAVDGLDPAYVEKTIDLSAFHSDLSQRREPILLDEAATDHRVDVPAGNSVGSLLAAPLIARDRLLGILYVTKSISHGFERDDVESISVFASQAALALDNARLFEQQIEKERLARELAIARDVQRRLLPQQLPILRGLNLAASSVPALEVGGDYYDFLKLDEHRMAFIIADVSGKGSSAAFYMAEMQGIFRALSRCTDGPRDFLVRANEALCDSLERRVFISVIYGIIDTEAETVRLARAGHCPAATISLHGEASFLRSEGLGLGLDRGALFERALAEEERALQPGDVFVLYTDGVVESRNADGKDYGYERLLDALREHRHEDADALHQALVGDLDAFIGEPTYDDDMTMAVIKWQGVDLPEHRRPADRSEEPEHPLSSPLQPDPASAR